MTETREFCLPVGGGVYSGECGKSVIGCEFVHFK